MKIFPATGAITLAALLYAPAAHAQDTTLIRALSPHAVAWEQLVAAEDARATLVPQLEMLAAGMRTEEAELRRIAVRALGRLERAELVDRIAPLLRDPSSRVRAAAANALGQAVSRGDGATARARLLPALPDEEDPLVVAVMAETLGRTRHANAGAARSTSSALALLLDHPEAAVRMGAVRGFYFLARQPGARAAIDAQIRTRLLQLATTADGAPALLHNRLRTIAAATWIAAAQPTAEGLAEILADTSAQVRREAAAGVLTLEAQGAARALLERALRDESGMVRYDAVRVYGRRFGQSDCTPLLNATRDQDAHVALQAIDLLGRSCKDTTTATQRLDSVAHTLPTQEHGAWHRAAHALVSLAAMRANVQATALLPRFVAHPNFFVRTYAANAADLLNDQSTLRKLAFDAHPNVRTAAVQGLARNAGHGADSIYLAQLQQSDNQLLMTAALALDSTSTPNVAPQLFDALDRISELRRETMRDSRVALLQTIRTIGDRTLAPRVEKYIYDYDPAVQALAAAVMEKWTGTRPAASLPAQHEPETVRFAEAAELARSTVRLEMANGGVVELRLLPFAAPTNAARFARLVRSGFFDGLTFHRVAPNFVVQGGSPNANEYAGDGPFTRDELQAANWRGTVGLSTRGRDTGDGQIFINLIDNVRLDHDYTVFAEVVRGLDVVDRILEGERIRRVILQN